MGIRESPSYPKRPDYSSTRRSVDAASIFRKRLAAGRGYLGEPSDVKGVLKGG
jgi:hypothetical protein